MLDKKPFFANFKFLQRRTEQIPTVSLVKKHENHSQQKRKIMKEEKETRIGITPELNHQLD